VNKTRNAICRPGFYNVRRFVQMALWVNRASLTLGQQCRRIATRDDKLAANYLAGVRQTRINPNLATRY
jgi:transposase